jgi:hypothetical protein
LKALSPVVKIVGLIQAQRHRMADGELAEWVSAGPGPTLLCGVFEAGRE